MIKRIIKVVKRNNINRDYEVKEEPIVIEETVKEEIPEPKNKKTKKTENND